MYSIYGIKEKEDDPVYYIGRTKNLQQRKRQHKYLGRTGVFVVLATCDNKEDAVIIERYYISKYRDTVNNRRERYYTGVSVKDIILNST